MRKRPEFPYLQATLTPPHSKTSELDRLEFFLLSLSDSEYDELKKPRVELNENAPSATGDAIGDAWEREFWMKHGTAET